MSPKPPLTVVPRLDPLAPPPGLGEAGRKLWHRVQADYVIDEASGLEMLTQICAAKDTVAKLEVDIERDGSTIRTKTGVRDHPALKHKLAAQSFIVRSLSRLNLDVIQPRTEPGRPSGGGAYRGESR